MKTRDPKQNTIPRTAGIYVRHAMEDGAVWKPLRPKKAEHGAGQAPEIHHESRNEGRAA